MLLYVIRHGEPDYKKDCLTETGRRQAAALVPRLTAANITDIFTSPLGRAQETAAPTAAALGLTPTVLPWTRELNDEERYVPYPDGIWRSFSIMPNHRFREGTSERLSYDEALREPLLAKSGMQAAQERTEREAQAWLASFGYRYEPEKGVYRIETPNDRRVALFCHTGFGRLFLSVLLRIPLNIMLCSMGYTYTGITVLEFRNFEEGYTAPRCLCYSDLSHLFAAHESLAYDTYRSGLEI